MIYEPTSYKGELAQMYQTENQYFYIDQRKNTCLTYKNADSRQHEQQKVCCIDDILVAD